jgi:integrase
VNLPILQQTYPELIAFLREKEYNHFYIERLERQIRYIIANADINGWTSYDDVYQWYAGRSDSKQGLRCRLTFLGIIERFALRGEYPDGRTRQKIQTRGRYQYLIPEFQKVMDTYRMHEEQLRAKKDRTIYREFSNGASFLYELQCSGINSLEEITQKSIFAVFLNENGTLRRSCSYKNIIAAVFRANVQTNPELFNRLIAYLPELRTTRKNIQYLTDEEVTRIKCVLTEPDSGLILRDRAIGTLALTYGLRCCDIANLKVDDIDFDMDLITICQQKTSIPITLPLTVSAGNAIYDYANLERPKNGSEFIFLSENRPYGRITDSSMGNIAAKIMAAAGIRQNAGDRKGFHIFRHRLATDLLGNGVPQPIISKITGHTSPDSLETYLSADFVHLKECSLSIEQFPLNWEVFANA